MYSSAFIYAVVLITASNSIHSGREEHLSSSGYVRVPNLGIYFDYEVVSALALFAGIMSLGHDV